MTPAILVVEESELHSPENALDSFHFEDVINNPFFAECFGS